MMTGKIHFDTTVEGESFTFICPVGCQTLRAFQASDEFRTYFFGKVREQQEQQAKSAEDPKESSDVVAEQPQG